MPEKNRGLSDVQSAMLIIVFSAIVMVIINKVFHISVFENNNNLSGNVQNSGYTNTGNIISGGIKPIIVEETGSIISGQIQTGEIIKSGNILPDEPRGIVDYIIKNGILNKDYLYADLYPQPVTHGKTSVENNAVYFKYISKYRYPFAIPTDKKSGYIFITLNKPLAKDRDIFLAINGSSIGPLIKAQSENVRNETEYLYPMNKIPAKGNKGIYITNLFDRVKNGILTLGGFVSESGNGIKNITIVLK